MRADGSQAGKATLRIVLNHRVKLILPLEIMCLNEIIWLFKDLFLSEIRFLSNVHGFLAQFCMETGNVANHLSGRSGKRSPGRRCLFEDELSLIARITALFSFTQGS